MHTAYIILLTIHISIGFVSLLLFWVPVLSRKGGRLHLLYGRWYSNAMYVVAGSAISLSILLLVDPIAAKFPLANFDAEKISQIQVDQKYTGLFLLAISVLVLSSIRHGLLTIASKKDHSLMRAPSHLALNGLLVGMGVFLFYTAMEIGHTLFFIFGTLCFVLGLQNLRYSLKKEVLPMEWLIAHLGAMIGAGIGSYTAFFVFGASRLFAELLSGYWSLVPWVLPGVIGGIATGILSRKYQLKYRKIRDKFKHKPQIKRTIEATG